MYIWNHSLSADSWNTNGYKQRSSHRTSILYCYELKQKNQKDYFKQDLVDKLNTTFRYLNDILSLTYPKFQIYPKEVQNKSNTSNNLTAFLDLDLIFEQDCLFTNV